MDIETFKKVFIPYYKKLYRIAFRFLQNKMDAEDVVQDTFIKLWNKRDEMDSVENTEAFAIIITRNGCLDYLRKTKNDYLTPNDTNISKSISLDNQLEMQDETNYLKALINKLPEQQRQIMELKHWDGCSDEEIRNITGLSSGNIRVIISRARKTIKKQYCKIKS